MRRIVQEGRVRLIQPVRLCEDDAPTVEIQIAGGTAVWRQNSTEVEVCVKDGEDAYGFSSGLRSVTCYTGRQIVAKRTWEYEGEQVYRKHCVLKWHSLLRVAPLCRLLFMFQTGQAIQRY